MSKSREASQATVESLAAAVMRVAGEWEAVERTTMFGKPSFRANGTLFAVTSEQGVSLTSLPDDARVAVAADHRILPFEANGRLIGSWVTVDIEPNRVGELTDALRASYETAFRRKA
ncbi:MmcQ/YjbR family DNA-binding protein [Haloferax sp. DFSO52]|uniref:MmcQ/YjbR family DNA-binding protein n=1 Tax=Haloferax sp. DFSO52 TaxID=3388505 RepID=UPI003A84EECD